jgi:hypothetical protein
MIKDSDIVFVTTTLNTKWLHYQSEIIKKLFPSSEHIVIDGSSNWPKAWFYWIDLIKGKNAQWFVHLDEDCFIESKDEIIRLIEKMDAEDLSLSAISDGYNHYRGANPVAINSFFMVGRIKDILDLNLDMSQIEFWNHKVEGWKNNLGISYKESYRKDFSYPHEIMGNSENCSYEQEPYYMVLWMLKERGKKFYYLYPHFDERFKSTNPRIDKDSPDIAIHMWYTRISDSPMDVHGMPNSLRYEKIETYLMGKK